MPQVPYKPVPTVQPTDRGVAPIGVRTQPLGPEVFGANVGGAISHAGTVLEGAGKELNDRAIAFQDLDNHNASSVATADFEKAATQNDVELKKLQGKAAVEYYKTYADTLESARQKIRDTLPNDRAKQLYDTESRNIFNRAYWTGGQYMADQFKHYTDASDKASEATSARQAYIDTSNYEIKGLDQNEQHIRDLYGDRWDKSAVDDKVFSSNSTIIRGTLLDLARTEPWSARQVLDRYRSRMTQDDQRDVANNIVDQMYDKAPKQVYSGFTRGDYTVLGAKKVPIERLLGAVGGFESSNNYGAGLYQIQHNIRDTHGVALGRYQVMSDYLPGFLKEAGMPQMTPEEFIANKEAQDQLARTVLQKYMDRYGTANDAASMWLSGKPMKEGIESGVHDRNQTTVAKYVAQINARLAKTATEREMADAVNGQITQLAPEEQYPLIKQRSDKYVAIEQARQERMLAEEEAGNRKSVLSALGRPQGPDGALITSKTDLFKDPATEAAYRHLNDVDKDHVDAALLANASNGFAPTDAKIDRYHYLSDLLRDPKGQEEFLKTNLLAEKFPWPVYDKLAAKQQAMLKQQQDAHVEHAIRWINQTVDGVPKKMATGLNTKWHTFNDEIADAIHDWRDRHEGKPPNDKEITSIGKAIVQKNAGSWYPWGEASKPLYMIPPTEKWLAQASGVPALQGASPEQLQRVYTRMLLRQVQEGKSIEEGQQQLETRKEKRAGE